jgi:5'-nucleotidase
MDKQANEPPRERSDEVVLVTNDDGIDSPGIVALAVALEARGLTVVVAAPSINMSGAAAAIGPVDPRVPARRLPIDGVNGAAFAVAAPPAMIVVAALSGAFGPVPTAIASGVNAGVNLGRAILHSGTVGAALTGQNLGLPAMAVSAQSGGDWDVAASFGADALDRLLDRRSSMLANVNVPRAADASTPVVTTRLARFGAVKAAIIGDELDFQLTIDPDAFDEPGSDGAAVRDGQVSVTWLSGLAGFTEAGLSEAGADFALTRVDATTEQ